MNTVKKAALAENKKDRLRVWIEVQGGEPAAARPQNPATRFPLKLGTRPRLILNPANRKRIVIRVARVRTATP